MAANEGLEKALSGAVSKVLAKFQKRSRSGLDSDSSLLQQGSQLKSAEKRKMKLALRILSEGKVTTKKLILDLVL